ncbi:hypothetical protein POV27_04315 [Aureisphaera galaxeae]|uniref:DUF6695 family protein n=1 Tax=Aureisphaera galaxeae TaxID=1538023 RepID=UPI002350EFAE|nr:DUF6695 family protein [Aureisphaera galaxeae]MDC8003260.1 hypothetical protein [Aureisphaera galaxeae]
MKHTGTLLVLAYPDTFVTMSDEWICNVLPLVGLGTREYIKAGHAALMLIENKTGEACYFDFGRYVTPKGHGRVRGANTDAELHVPIKAKFCDIGMLKNNEELLLWLDANPHKTHGEGRLLASICYSIDFKKAQQYIDSLQGRGSIPYGAFNKDGSNCSRFVTETILASTSDEKVVRALKFNKKFTPSTVGNVEKAASLGTVYEVFEGNVKPFKGSAFKENLTNYFDKKRPNSHASISERNIPEHAQKLSGTGSNAWFELILDEELPKSHFRIRRYNDLFEVDYDGIYVSEVFDAYQPFQFTYDSHCGFCHVIQGEEKIRLDGIASYTVFNSSRKVRSA